MNEHLLRSRYGFIVPQVLARMTGLPIEYLVGGNHGPSAREFDGESVTEQSRCADPWTEEAHRLAKLLLDPDVVEGILTCNWVVVDCLQDWAHRAIRKPTLNSHDRGKLQTIALYLQRLCGKCDSNGAYGPVFWGSLDSEAEKPVEFVPEKPTFGIGKRAVNTSYWIADTILKNIALSALPLDSRVPRRDPMAFVRAGCLIKTIILQHPPRICGPSPVDSKTIKIFELCDGDLTVVEIAARSGLPLNEVEPVIQRLAEDGWVFLGPEIPVGVSDPLRWLADWVRAGGLDSRGERVLEVVRSLVQYRESYREERGLGRKSVIAAATECFNQATGIPGTRGAGMFYADRFVYAEDAMRDWKDLRLGRPIVRLLQEELLLLLRALMVIPSVRWLQRQRSLAAWFDQVFNSRSVSLPEFCEALATEAEEIASRFERVDDAVENVSRELLDLLVTQGTGINGERHVHPSILLDFLHNYPVLPCTVQCDIMIIMNTRPPRIVLGDVHAVQDLLINGLHVLLHPAPDQLVRTVWAGYEAVFREKLCVPILEHTDKTLVSLPLPTQDVEIVGRSRKDGAMRWPAGCLRVIRQDDQLRLVAPDGTPVLFTRVPTWGANRRSSALALFAPPFVARLEDDLWPRKSRIDVIPRVVVGNVVAFRRAWILRANTLSPERGPAAFDDALETWRCRVGVHQRVFVRLPSERKPVLIEFRNPYLKEWLRKRLLKEAEVEFIEMYPDVDDLWLHDTKGRYCIEFRMSAFLPGSDHETGG